MQRALFWVICFSCVSLSSIPSQAATVQPVQGTLSINQGQGFSPVNGPVAGNVGDSVMVVPGGAATIVYDDGCKVDVQPGTVTTIAPLSPCASGSYAQANYNNGYGWGGWVLGAGALGLAGWGIYEATRSPNNGTSPASP
jgi:hypothetical protein